MRQTFLLLVSLLSLVPCYSSLMLLVFMMVPFMTCAGSLKVSRFTTDIARNLNLKHNERM